jgi:hypothetical protein
MLLSKSDARCFPRTMMHHVTIGSDEPACGHNVVKQDPAIKSILGGAYVGSDALHRLEC